MIGFGIGLLQDLSPRELQQTVSDCERLGYDRLWYANEKFFRDPWIGLTLAARSSSTMRLGTFIADPYTMHPALIAVAAATLDEVADGRFALLLGAGGTGLARMGIPRRRPVQAIREAVEVIRPLLAGETVTYHGETLNLDRLKLSFPARRDIPIYVAARGDKALAMAGAVADGVMIATYATPRGVRHALERVGSGAERSGRTLDDLTLFSRVDGWIDPVGDRARDAIRPMIARLLAASHPDRTFVDAAGVCIPEKLERVIATRHREQAQAAAALVTDDLVDAFSWAGTAADVAARVGEIVKLGIREITFMPHAPDGETVGTGIAAFAKDVIPAVTDQFVRDSETHP